MKLKYLFESRYMNCCRHVMHISHHPSCILKLCRDLMVRPYRYIFSIVRCPRRGTMRLHILRGMKAEVILAFADICTHEVYMKCDITMLLFWFLPARCGN
jgi:hypothetical protein